MPGPVSDSHDPEWGTSVKASEIEDAIERLYDRVSGILGHRDPVYICELVSQEDELSDSIQAVLSEWEWRIIRFALERAGESI